MSRLCNGTTSDDIKHIAIDIPLNKAAPLTPARKKSLWQGLKEIYFEFCSNTSIHGFQYFGQQRPWKEVLFWLAVFIISIYFCSLIIVRIYVKWSETPVIVSLSEKSTPIWNIPFPAVTICPETQRPMNKTAPSYANLLDGLKTFLADGLVFQPNFTSAELEEVLTLLHLCDLKANTNITSYALPPVDYMQRLQKMLPDFQKYCYDSIWFGNETGCDKFFARVYTDEGTCFTFNSLKVTDLYREDTLQYQLSLENSETSKSSLSWSLEGGYGQTSEVHTYPARVLSSGSTSGYVVTLQNFANEVDYSCRYITEGYKVLLHSPDEAPSLSKHFMRVSMGKDIMVAVKPKMMTTSAGIAEYPPQKRQCYLDKERHLKYFKIYSQNNCELECLTNFTANNCGCVKFSMPRTPDMPVCGADKIPCYSRAREQLLFKQFSEGLKNTKHTSGDEFKCHCLPACTSLDYETEISEGSLNVAKTLDAMENVRKSLEKYTDLQLSTLTIYFKENQFITSRRSELYGVTDLLANFGGVCGLFMGISILSVVEMLYHFTLRLWSTMTRPREVK